MSRSTEREVCIPRGHLCRAFVSYQAHYVNLYSMNAYHRQSCVFVVVHTYSKPVKIPKESAQIYIDYLRTLWRVACATVITWLYN